jgi:hypothetical protein
MAWRGIGLAPANAAAPVGFRSIPDCREAAIGSHSVCTFGGGSGASKPLGPGCNPENDGILY